MKFISKIHVVIGVVVGVLGLTLATQADAQKTQKTAPKTAPDDTWITVSGTVVKADPDSFRLDYGEGVITVEMDDFDFYSEGKNLMENDEVVVYGRIDDDLFEKRTIEAESVYVKDLMTHFYASAADEEDFRSWTISPPITIGRVEVSGIVTSIEGPVFTMDTGRREVRVDTSSLTYNPLDDIGFLQVDVGDRVKVTGTMSNALFQERVLSANWITEFRR